MAALEEKIGAEIAPAFGAGAPSDHRQVLGGSAVPRWRGERNRKLRLAVLCPSGNGDVIQFSRFLPIARRLVGRTLLVATPPLVPILDADEIYSVDQEQDALHRADAWTTLEMLCAIVATGYATQYAGRFRRDRARRRDFGPGRHVGIVWAGSPINRMDADRSATVDALAPLAAVEGVTWHSLQVGVRAPEIARAPLPMVDHSAGIRDFGDTLAIVDALDMVIGVETATIHLACSIGKPTLLALAQPTDWRWNDRGEDADGTAWYPFGARLFRQPSPGDWGSVFSRMADELAAARKRSRQS
jgi:hypothetical protein